MITTITSILFFFSAATLLLFWTLLFSRLLFYKKEKQKPKILPGVSIIIAAYNESSNLRAKIPTILTQKYPTYEVIVIDDQSTDQTSQKLAEFSKEYKHLRYAKTEIGQKGKKQALTLGVQMAKHDLILTTDADCFAASANWIMKMVSQLDQNHMVLGYGPMLKTKGLLNSFSRFETSMTAIQYFSWAIAGHPYMGVGRNLMYHKNIFDQVEGFEKHTDLKSGDDDLFVQAASPGNKIGICINPSAFMFSSTEETWQSFRKQKLRHISTASRYRRSHQIGLTIFSAAQMIFYPVFLIAILIHQSWMIWLIFFITILIKMCVFSGISKKLAVRDLFFYFPLLDIAYSVYLWVLVPNLMNKTPIEWKSSESTFQISTQNKQHK